MLNFLQQLDRAILVAIHEAHHPVLDTVIPLFREKFFWIPLYVFIIAFMLINFKKRGGSFLIFFFITVGLGDTISSKLIKFSVQRLRPCHVEDIRTQLEMLVPCGGQFGFTSSHATNHFAIAVLLIVTLGGIFPRVRIPLILWAVLVSFAQVYVGVHYPFDILGGALLGSLIGLAMGSYFNYRVGLTEVGEGSLGKT